MQYKIVRKLQIRNKSNNNKNHQQQLIRIQQMKQNLLNTLKHAQRWQMDTWTELARFTHFAIKVK